MINQQNDFVTPATVEYQFRLGKYVASSLSGFIAGVVAASIVWVAVAYFTNVIR